MSIQAIQETERHDGHGVDGIGRVLHHVQSRRGARADEQAQLTNRLPDIALLKQHTEMVRRRGFD